ncbi:MAG TPA: hypothetical protein VJK52_02670 [Candidatus Nanoarchaeia archaeon]|nr:hypothetical protein [Candidatus Nanoarchaeia archaeon]
MKACVGLYASGGRRDPGRGVSEGFSGAAFCGGALLVEEETELWEDDEDDTERPSVAAAEEEDEGGKVVTGATIASSV